MCPPTASPLADIGFDCSDEELFKSLDKMNSGLPLPGNVITDVNPYNHAPENLRDCIWYLIHSKDNATAGHEFWKVKGEARLFSNSDIDGWRTTVEFFEGQAPNAGKTNWLMYEYWINRKRLGESGQVKERRSLCRVFLAGKLGRDQQNKASSHNSSIALHQPKQSTVIEAHNSCGCCCTNKPEVNNDSGTFFVTGRPLDHHIEHLPEIDDALSGDFLELRDLDDAISLSSSENSSCLTMSSNECFDYLALLRELEPEELPSQEPLQNVDHCKFSVFTSVKPDKVVILPDSPGLFVNSEGRNLPSEEIIRTDSLLPGSTNCDNKDVDNKVKRQSSVRKEELHHREEGPLNLHEVGQSSRSQNVSPSGGKRDARGRMERPKRKCMCFMPFHLLL